MRILALILILFGTACGQELEFELDLENYKQIEIKWYYPDCDTVESWRVIINGDTNTYGSRNLY